MGKFKTNFLALPYVEPGQYIAAHDPSFTNETFEKAVTEARYDIEHGASVMAVYKLVAVIKGQEIVEVSESADGPA